MRLQHARRISKSASETLFFFMHPRDKEKMLHYDLYRASFRVVYPPKAATTARPPSSDLR